MRGVNDAAATWARMWAEQVRLGCIPYYMFVARETGASEFFAVPLAEATETFATAYRERLRASRGRFAARAWQRTKGKVVIEGEARVAGERVFVLSYVQARDPEGCRTPVLRPLRPVRHLARSARAPLTASRTVTPGAVVVGAHINGLGVVRALGARGVPIVVVSTQPYDLAEHSRWVSERHQLREFPERPETLIEFLEHNESRWPRWAVFPTTDDALTVLAQHHGTALAHVPTGARAVGVHRAGR